MGDYDGASVTALAPSGAQLRPAEAADIDAVHAIECEAFPDPWSMSSFREMLLRDQGWITVAVDNTGVIVGYSVAWTVLEESEIANLAVAKRARRNGVGALLLDSALRAAASAGARTAFLEVRESNLAGQRLYESREFVVVGRRRAYYDHPLEDALVLRRML